MVDTEYPQCRIVSERFLNPDTTEKLLNEIIAVQGIRRIVINGPNIPQTVPYGPARGLPNPHTGRASIQVGDAQVDLKVQVGTILLELESRDLIPKIEEACKKVHRPFSFMVKEGKFMRSTPTQTDYAKYGPEGDPMKFGLVDPKSKTGPVIIQGNR